VIERRFTLVAVIVLAAAAAVYLAANLL